MKKKYPRRKNGKRDAILTVQDRIHLTSEKTSLKTLNKIQKNIDKRLEALEIDLSIIEQSKQIEGWKSCKFTIFQKLGQTFTDIGFSFKPVYPYVVKRYKKNIDKRRLFVYWIDESIESHLTHDRIFEPSFALRKIKSSLTDNSIKTLTKAVESGIIPTFEDNAKPEESFESAFHDQKKLSLLQESVYSPGKKVIVQLKPEIEKARKQEKETWTFVRREVNKLNRKLVKKFGLTVVDIRLNSPKINSDF